MAAGRRTDDSLGNGMMRLPAHGKCASREVGAWEVSQRYRSLKFLQALARIQKNGAKEFEWFVLADTDNPMTIFEFQLEHRVLCESEG